MRFMPADNQLARTAAKLAALHLPLRQADSYAEATMSVRDDILQCIGNTSLVLLRRVAPAGHARILLKMESENPTGSMKDRMALAMIEAAERDGRLKPGAPVVEYTTGSTGTSLALVCGIKGHPLHIVTSDAFAHEKRDHMAILGAELHVLASESGRMTEKLTQDMIAAARELAAETGGYWTDQLRNGDQIAAYQRLADEIWTTCDGRVDAFVQVVGSAGCIRGTSEALKRRHPALQVHAVEPAESPVLSGGCKGAHGIDGMGAGFVVPLWQPSIATGIERVSTDEALDMSLRLAREEGIVGGLSTGANVTAAVRIAGRLGAHATVVTMMCDSGAKYLSKYGRAVARVIAA
jgi:cysteine synthase A